MIVACLGGPAAHTTGAGRRPGLPCCWRIPDWGRAEWHGACETDALLAEPPLQRILSVDYQLPYNKAVSAECKDLLQRILVADPTRRITMADIQRHPWYRPRLHAMPTWPGWGRLRVYNPAACLVGKPCRARAPHPHVPMCGGVLF